MAKEKPKFRNIAEATAAGYGTSFFADPPKEPTDLQPGSRDKIELMRQRMESGEEIFHEEDRNNRAKASDLMWSSYKDKPTVLHGIQDSHVNTGFIGVIK